MTDKLDKLDCTNCGNPKTRMIGGKMICTKCTPSSRRSQHSFEPYQAQNPLKSPNTPRLQKWSAKDYKITPVQGRTA